MTNTLPHWLRREIPQRGDAIAVRSALKRSSLKTVCEEARCPNLGECFCSGTATFIVMGNACSRHCRFCSVTHGSTVPLQDDEKVRLLETVQQLNLKYIVLTSVTRDDLPDGGSEHIAEIVRYLKLHNEQLRVELLIPDFNGDADAVQRVIDSGADVIGHNVEMAPRLYEDLRPQAKYEQSLEVLKQIAEQSSLPSKTGIMVGLGETAEEVETTISDIARIGVDILTIGQYFQPTKYEIEVDRFVTPEEFKSYRIFAETNGISHVESAPYVRSSYHADRIFNNCKNADTSV